MYSHTGKFVSCLYAALSLSLSSTGAIGAASCNQSPLKISASIEFINPDNATLTVRHAGVADRQARVGDCLIAGDRVIVPATVKLAKVFTNERLIRLQPDTPPYVVTGGMVRIASQAATYLAAVVHALSSEPAPDLPNATASRSFADPPLSALRAIAGLNVASTQRIPGSVAQIILAWQPLGAAPRCALESAAGGIEASPGAEESWCALRAPDGMTEAVVSIDGANPAASIQWKVVRAADADVPRPAWLDPDSRGALSNADRAVWGLWLYREAGTEWRLAGLSMLVANRSTSWATARATREIIAR
ncbi:MAG TPA: hypothetical protein VGE92_07345 [Steroidobacteraceae bacterium]|jgi:hypothetical protein